MKKVMFTAFAVGLCMTANVMAQVPSYVPTNGLVGWWPFNGNANDESGNGNNGTVNGATLTTDRFGVLNKAYSFDGVDDYVNVNNSSTLNPSQLSINCWILANENNLCIMEKGNVLNATEHTFGLTHNDIWQIQRGLKSSFGIGSCGTTNSNVTWGTYGEVTNSTWTMITVSIDNLGIIKHYINGQLVYTSSSGIQLSSCNSPSSTLRFGGPHWNSDPEWFNGFIDDIGIWNRTLSLQEISDMYNVTNCSNDLTISPISNSQNIGGNVTFSANTSDANASYSWQSDFGQGFQTLNNYGNYSGANTNTLTISNVQLAEHNQQIRAISTSGNCIDTSNVATIQIADTCITNVTIYDTLLTTITDTLIINTTLSLPAPNNENTILIYPNPASDHITIDNGNFAAMAGYSIKIENNAGQQVFQSAINQAQFYVDLSTWTGNGLYFVHLIDPQNNTVTVRKIVLQ